MAGILQFTLGLATGQFVANAQRAQQAIGGIAKAGLALPGIGTALAGGLAGFASARSAIESVFDAFENGARLDHLSKRTSVSVGELFQLEKAFKAAGVGAENVSTLLLQMQKSLGGFSEFGEPTKDIFRSMGLSIDELKAKKAPEAMQAILEKLAMLRPDEATMAAGKIFGRAGLGDAMQLAHSGNAMRDSMAGSAEQAALFARNAQAFEKIEQSLEKVKGIGKGFFAGIAEGAAPGIQQILDVLNKIDLRAIGKKVGDVIGVAVEAIKEGRLGEILSLTLQAGFERGIGFAADLLGNGDFWMGIVQTAFGAFASLGGFLIKMFMTVQDFGNAAFEKIALTLVEKLGETKIGQLLGLDAVKAPSLKDLFNARRDASKAAFDAGFGSDFFQQAMGFTSDGVKDIKSAFAQAAKASTGSEAETALNKLWDDLMSHIKKTTPEEIAPAGGLVTGADGKLKTPKSAVSNLESIGLLFFSQRGATTTDYARQTATNTSRTNNILEKVHTAVKGLDLQLKHS